MKLKCIVLLLLGVCVSTFSIRANEPMNEIITPQQAIDKFVGDSALRYASVGVSVVSLDSMDVVAEYNPYQSQITASTMKTVTSATALKLLGKDFRFHTHVVADGEISKKGKLKGDLLIKGGGDPTLGSCHFQQSTGFVDSLVLILKEYGINEIQGDVVVDDMAYPSPYVPASWMIEDLGYGYGTGVHALNFADNTLKLNVNIGHDTFEYDTDQYQSYLSVENHCTVMSEENDSVSISGLGLRLDIENDILHLSGNVKPDKIRMTIANPSPDQLLRDSLLFALEMAGIEVKCKNIDKEDRVTSSRLLDYTSPALSDIVKSLLERSDNMYTECVLRAIAVNAHKQATAENGVEIVKEFWKERGVDVEGLFMLDGSGLSRTNKAPVSFFTHMLAVAEKELREDGIEFHEHFPVAGINGTVKRVAAGTSAAGKFALKSGSMSHVQCYVGYYPVENPQYTVGILINSFTCPRSELVKMVSDMLVGIDSGLSQDKSQKPE